LYHIRCTDLKELWEALTCEGTLGAAGGGLCSGAKRGGEGERSELSPSSSLQPTNSSGSDGCGWLALVRFICVGLSGWLLGSCVSRWEPFPE
jgi:hypothetical protein